MFTDTLSRRMLGSPLVDLLTGPHGVDRYTELVAPTWALGEARAKVVAVRRGTPRSVTLTLEPNRAGTRLWAGFRAGQHINLTVEVQGRRRTRCYSPANGEGAPFIQLTVGLHDGGLVSTHLVSTARPGMVVGLDGVGGDFVLPGKRGQRPRRILFVSGGSGITPVMSMLRTLRAERHDGRVAFIHYARSRAEACYRDELAAMADVLPDVRVLHGFTRSRQPGDLDGHFGPAHLAAAMASPGCQPDAVYVCGPPALVAAVREHCDNVRSESFVPPVFGAATESSGARVAFADSAITVTDDGRSLLEQAEAAGLAPATGCRMGICHTCTRRKTRGVVRNLITGATSSADEEDVQICVSAPVGDVEVAL